MQDDSQGGGEDEVCSDWCMLAIAKNLDEVSLPVFLVGLASVKQLAHMKSSVQDADEGDEDEDGDGGVCPHAANVSVHELCTNRNYRRT